MNEDREIKNYEKLTARAKQVVENSKKTSGAWIDEALESAADQLEEAAEFTKQEGRRAREFLRKDLEATKVDFDEAAKATKAALDPSRAGAGFADLASHLFDSLGDTFKDWAAKSEASLSFRTGQITGPGTLTCKACGTELHVDDTSTEFPLAQSATKRTIVSRSNAGCAKTVENCERVIIGTTP